MRSALLLLLFVTSTAHAASIGNVGNLLVNVGAGGVSEFDGVSGELLGTFIAAQLNSFVFAGPALYATAPSDEILRYDARTGTLLGAVVGPANVTNPSRIRAAPDGSMVFLNQQSGTPSLDRLSASGSYLGTLSSVVVNDFAFGPTGNIYATTPSDQIVEIDFTTGLVVDVVTTSVLNPGPLLFLQDGSLVVRDGHGVQRYTESGTFLGLFSSYELNDMTLGPDGALYGTVPTDEVIILDRTSGALLGTFASTPANPGALAFRPVPEPGTALLIGVGLALLATPTDRRTRWGA